MNDINELQQLERDLTLEVATLEEKVSSNKEVTPNTLDKLIKRVNAAIRSLKPKQPSLPVPASDKEIEDYKSAMEQFTKYSIAFASYNVFPSLRERLGKLETVVEHRKHFKTGDFQTKAQLLEDLMEYMEAVCYSYSPEPEAKEVAEIIDRYLP